jgi:hypothetical protein
MPDMSYPENLACGYLEPQIRLMKKIGFLGILILLCVVPCIPLEKESSNAFYSQGTIYLDWFGFHYPDSGFFSQLSTRIRLQLFNRRGSGWTFTLDGRDRLRFKPKSQNQVLLYDARFSFEKPGSLFFLSLGQMNLYDTAGIGQLLGGVFAVKPKPEFMIGGYVGLETNIYIKRTEADYQKFGIFTQYKGVLGRRLSLSYNHIRYSGMLENHYLYFNGMYPFGKHLVLFGNMEYQLGSNIKSKDRLSRLFLNLRCDPIDWMDLSAFYSSGKGLDFHNFVLEQSQDPVFNDQYLERYYYSTQYGMRISLKPTRSMRFFLSRQEREQMDDEIQNHTWIIGGSLLNILNTGLSAYGNYASNRGEISESDSYYVSISKDFGKVAWNTSFSNTYNGLRFDYRTGMPQIIHLDDYQTLSTFFFITLNRHLAVSLEYEFFIQEEANQHLFFVRLICRTF